MIHWIQRSISLIFDKHKRDFICFTIFSLIKKYINLTRIERKHSSSIYKHMQGKNIKLKYKSSPHKIDAITKCLHHTYY